MVTLQNVLRMNASTCFGFGALFSTASDSVVNFLSLSSPAPSFVLLILGLGLIFQSVHLLWASFQASPNKALILYFSMGDFAWSIASLILIFMGLWINSVSGILFACLVALMVSILGAMQMRAYKQEQCSDSVPSKGQL